MLIKERLRFTLGSKLEHNSYTAFQHQPNSRLTWTPAKRQTIWAAASRAVINPARIDRDFSVSLFPNFPLIMGSDSFLSETALAYELGWRFQALKKLAVSLSGFYTIYDKIRSAESGPLLFKYPIIFANGVKGETYGVELSANSKLTRWWNLRGEYTFLRKELVVKPTNKDINKGTAESNDPEHQLLLQSYMDLPHHFQFGTVVRYVDNLPKPEVSYYIGLDTYEHHAEFIASTPPCEIERSIYGKITCRF